jgi:hypothetical protein
LLSRISKLFHWIWSINQIKIEKDIDKRAFFNFTLLNVINYNSSYNKLTLIVKIMIFIVIHLSFEWIFKNIIPSNFNHTLISLRMVFSTFKFYKIVFSNFSIWKIHILNTFWSFNKKVELFLNTHDKNQKNFIKRALKLDQKAFLSKIKQSWYQWKTPNFPIQTLLEKSFGKLWFHFLWKKYNRLFTQNLTVQEKNQVFRLRWTCSNIKNSTVGMPNACRICFYNQFSSLCMKGKSWKFFGTLQN